MEPLNSRAEFKTGLERPNGMLPERDEESMEGLKKLLFKMGNQYEEMDSWSILLEEDLNIIDEQLELLRVKFPNDAELNNLVLVYEDLRSDFEQKGEVPMEIDSAYVNILEKVRTEVAASPIRVEVPNESIASEDVNQLRELGIEANYVVSSGDPEAKTVVLFLQIHPNPGMNAELRDKLGVTASQSQIYNAIQSGVGADLITTVYAEGLAMSSNLGLDNATLRENNAAVSFLQAEKELGVEMNLIGGDYMPLLFQVIEHDLKGEWYLVRTVIQNALIGEEVADLMRRSEDDNMSFFVFGAAHELSFHQDPHELPLSQVLALNGVNVVVVDAATPYFKEPDSETIKELEKVVSAMKAVAQKSTP